MFRSLIFSLFIGGLLMSASAHAIKVKVSIENLAPTDGNFLTPVWVGFHDGTFDLYGIGAAASPELERLSEDGNASPLSTAFATSGAGLVDATIAGPGGPYAPGDSASFEVSFDIGSTDPIFFSYASMVIPSNDAFIANGNPLAHVLIDAGNFFDLDIIVLGSAVLDAGTEVNDEVSANTAFLGQTAPNTGTPENGVVGLHPGFTPDGNILAAFQGADFKQPGYQVARIRVTQIPEPSAWALLGLGLAGIGYQSRRIVKAK